MPEVLHRLRPDKSLGYSPRARWIRSRSWPIRCKLESVRHRTRTTDTDKGLPAMENDLVLLSLTAHQRGFSELTRFHRCYVRILAIFGRATEVAGRACATPSVEALLLAPTRVKVNRTGRISLANLQAG